MQKTQQYHGRGTCGKTQAAPGHSGTHTHTRTKHAPKQTGKDLDLATPYLPEARSRAQQLQCVVQESKREGRLSLLLVSSSLRI